MVKTNFVQSEYKPKNKAHKKGDIQYWYARFNDKTTDGITYCVETVIDHEPVESDFTALKQEWLDKSKTWKVLEVQYFAKTDTIKHFTVNGNQVWIDSETRTSLSKAVNDKEAAGRTEVTLYLGGIGYTVTIAQAKDLLAKVEIYASDCFEVTEEHKSTIKALLSIEEVDAYDYTKNYPTPLEFTFE